MKSRRLSHTRLPESWSRPVYRLVYHGKRFLPPTTASDFFTQKRNPLKWRVLADIVW